MSVTAKSYPRPWAVVRSLAQELASVVANPKTVFGIKVALAGLLAVYLSQLIRLGHSSWALFTVLVLAPA